MPGSVKPHALVLVPLWTLFPNKVSLSLSRDAAAGCAFVAAPAALHSKRTIPYAGYDNVHSPPAAFLRAWPYAHGGCGGGGQISLSLSLSLSESENVAPVTAPLSQ